LPKRDGHDLARVLARKAAGDEATLDSLLDDRTVPDEVLGFHAQQAVEKRIKSVLASREIEFERTHNIAYLLGLLADHDIPAPPDPDVLSSLTPWAADFRYADSAGQALDRARARELVQAVREWAELSNCGFVTATGRPTSRIGRAKHRCAAADSPHGSQVVETSVRSGGRAMTLRDRSSVARVMNETSASIARTDRVTVP
jgi:HEPN domain-containing protein